MFIWVVTLDLDQNQLEKLKFGWITKLDIQLKI